MIIMRNIQPVYKVKIQYFIEQIHRFIQIWPPNSGRFQFGLSGHNTKVAGPLSNI